MHCSLKSFVRVFFQYQPVLIPTIFHYKLRMINKKKGSYVDTSV